MSRSSAKGKGRRLSRTGVPQRCGDLRGLSARDYYAREEMSRGILGKLRPLLDPGLWKKLDRGKPIGGDQAEEVLKALGRVAVGSKCWPFSWPVVRMRPKSVGARRPAAEFQHVRVDGIPKVATPDGCVFVPTRRTVAVGGREGVVGFSRHAVEQWLARTHYAVRHVAGRLGLPELAMRTLEAAVLDGVVEPGAHGPCLAVTHEGEAVGYFPLARTEVGGRDAWVCKTFLRPGMRGVPGELACGCPLCVDGGEAEGAELAAIEAFIDELESAA